MIESQKEPIQDFKTDVLTTDRTTDTNKLKILQLREQIKITQLREHTTLQLREHQTTIQLREHSEIFLPERLTRTISKLDPEDSLTDATSAAYLDTGVSTAAGPN